MCYGCKPFCENCKPKFVFCDNCGKKNFLINETCVECGFGLTAEAKEKAKAVWAQEHERPRKKEREEGI